MNKPTYTVTLAPAAGNWRTKPEARLRAALKALLRGYGLRCTAINTIIPAVGNTPAAGAARDRTENNFVGCRATADTGPMNGSGELAHSKG